jgi:hypothetical protein
LSRFTLRKAKVRDIVECVVGLLILGDLIIRFLWLERVDPCGITCCIGADGMEKRWVRELV